MMLRIAAPLVAVLALSLWAVSSQAQQVSSGAQNQQITQYCGGSCTGKGKDKQGDEKAEQCHHGKCQGKDKSDDKTDS